MEGGRLHRDVANRGPFTPYVTLSFHATTSASSAHALRPQPKELTTEN